MASTKVVRTHNVVTSVFLTAQDVELALMVYAAKIAEIDLALEHVSASLKPEPGVFGLPGAPAMLMTPGGVAPPSAPVPPGTREVVITLDYLKIPENVADAAS